MEYTARSQKWGDPEIGTASDEITWGANLWDGLQYNETRYDYEDFHNALQDAFDAWESISGLNFTYIGTGDADIDVFTGVGDGAVNGVVGIASWNGGSTIRSASILFDENETWAPTGSGGVDFYAVALHEIGHTFGLNHYDLSTQIMNSTISASDLQSGDIAGAQYLYGNGGLIAPSDPVAPVLSPPDPPSDPSPPSADPDPDPDPVDDGGSSGGAIGAVVALLGLVFGAFFGGGLGAVALAAGRTNGSDEEGSEDTDPIGDDILLSDLVPVVEDQSHEVWVDDDGNFIAAPHGHYHGDGHDHGLGCDCCTCSATKDETDDLDAVWA